MGTHRKRSLSRKILHFFRLHDWKRTGILGSPETGLYTRQECSVCPSSRVNKFFDEGSS